MADPFNVATEENSGTTTDFLGQTVPISFRGQPALPVGGPLVGGGAAPATVGGGGAAPALPGGGTAASGAQAPPSNAVLRALALAGEGGRLASKLTNVLGTDQGVGATTTPSGQQTSTAPEVLRERQFGTPDALPGEGLTPADAALAAEAEGGAAVADAGGASFGDVAGGVVAGAGLGLGLTSIAKSNLSTGDKAAMAAHQAARAVADYAGLGIPSLVDEVIQLFGGPSGSSLFADVFGIGGGHYQAARQRAGGQASAGLEALGGVYRGAAEKGAAPGDVLGALATGEANGKIRSALYLPTDVASSLGVEGTQRGDQVAVEWSTLNPEQFGKLLTIYQERPELVDLIQGSGDVPYVPQEAAQAYANAAASSAKSLIQFTLSQQEARTAFEQAVKDAQAQMQPEAPAPPGPETATMAPGGGATAEQEALLLQ